MARKFSFNLDDDTDIKLGNISKALSLKHKSSIIRLGINNLDKKLKLRGRI